MEISTKNNSVNIDAYVNQVQEKNKVNGPGEKTSQQTLKTDTVEISDTAKRIQEAKKQLDAIPDVREDKVAELKNKIESGTYEIDTEKVAGKMLTESLMNDLLKDLE